MAPVVGLSVAAVKRRVDRMRETGLITGFSVQIDHAQLGWGIEAFAELRYTGRTRVSDIVASTAKIPEVQAVYGTAGDPDALIHLRVRDVAHLRDVIDTLRATGTVTGTKTLMVLGSWTRDT
jgi:DNA-binding Lrp family transcriptional regulator